MWADLFVHCIVAAEYIRYQPSKAGGETNSGASERIIKMHEMPVDPLEPPKFKHKKAPRGPPSPPVPVMHSPPRKVSQKDMQDWKIPPCVSNWKNAKGYTIPLDKRLAAGIADACRVLLCLMLRAAVAAAVRLGISFAPWGLPVDGEFLRGCSQRTHILTPSRATWQTGGATRRLSSATSTRKLQSRCSLRRRCPARVFLLATRSVSASSASRKKRRTSSSARYFCVCRTRACSNACNTCSKGDHNEC